MFFHKWLIRKFFLDLWGSVPHFYGGKLNKENSFFFFLQASGFHYETMTYLWKHARNKDVPHQVRPGNTFHTCCSLKLKRLKKRAAPQAVLFSGHSALTQGTKILKIAIISPITGLTQMFFMTLMKSLRSKAGLESRNQDEWRADIFFPPSLRSQKP